MEFKDITTELLSAAMSDRRFNVVRLHEVKQGSKWVEKETETRTMTDQEKDRFQSKDTLRWFRNLGGRETVKQGTLKGFGATINVSLSPDRSERKTTYFLF